MSTHDSLGQISQPECPHAAKALMLSGQFYEDICAKHPIADNRLKHLQTSYVAAKRTASTELAPQMDKLLLGIALSHERIQQAAAKKQPTSETDKTNYEVNLGQLTKLLGQYPEIKIKLRKVRKSRAKGQTPMAESNESAAPALTTI